MHKAASEILAKSDLIVYEELKIRNMIRRHRAKQDEAGKYLSNSGAKAGLNKFMVYACWRKFLSILNYKTQGMGKKFIAVNPAKTSPG